MTDWTKLERPEDFAEGRKTDAEGHPVDTRTKHVCDQCAGTGIWHSYRRRSSGKCHACAGRGFFLSSAVDRQKKRYGARKSKAKRLETSSAAFEETHPGLVATLAGMTSWNDFAKSLVDQFGARGELSDKQVEVAERMIAKTKATRAAQAEKRTGQALAVNLGAIRDMFETAIANGQKRPRYRAEGLVISRAADIGMNGGYLYVKSNDPAGGTYLGKISPDNRFFRSSEADDAVAERLRTIAANPLKAAVKYGQQTGECACCGRELTNPESVERGIGPICAATFGI